MFILRFYNYGLKRGPQINKEGLSGRLYCLPKADLYLDCRILSDTQGQSLGYAIRYFKEHHEPTLLNFTEQILDAIRMIPTRRSEALHPFNKPVDIALVCAWGVNRSRTAKYIIAERFKEMIPTLKEISKQTDVVVEVH